ncbi:hypothetical protein AWB79_05128 [Caballeronia hypogeia]|uniref:Uncharacterized protein n=1 Tax=Caballeronia hypogeia TaxID=1777140 RepID=A0A158CCF6_9BURK|nr:hypothetical protein AWB79_05128 [Caballeronia hypogeia]
MTTLQATNRDLLNSGTSITSDVRRCNLNDDPGEHNEKPCGSYSRSRTSRLLALARRDAPPFVDRHRSSGPPFKPRSEPESGRGKNSKKRFGTPVLTRSMSRSPERDTVAQRHGDLSRLLWSPPLMRYLIGDTSEISALSGYSHLNGPGAAGDRVSRRCEKTDSLTNRRRSDSVRRESSRIRLLFINSSVPLCGIRCPLLP